MQRRMLAVLVSLVAALACSPAALAKGVISAEIEGPGLRDALALRGGDVQGGDPPLLQLADLAGLFPAAFGQSPDPMLARRPAGELGPRYTISWVLAGPYPATIRQDVYPYARSGPLTYMKPGQEVWDGQQTRGGWYQASAVLKKRLLDDGLSPTPPSGDGGGFFDVTAISALAAAALALLFAAFAIVRVRRRPGPLTAG